jgi:hypothetical protein
MLLYRLISKILQTTLSIILLLPSFAIADEGIGSIVESTGIGQILRNQESVSMNVDTEIVLNDVAETGKGRMLIEFLDKAQLALKEHSEVLIDEVYYDADPSLSKMTMKFTMGTARFASGRLGLVNKANIDISTPTASIAIRGTDFTTTVDELGRSLVILLPDEYGNPSGEIEIENLGGTVTLTEAYQATMVSSLDTPPTRAVKLTGITPAVIDNMFIVAPPPEVSDRIQEELADDQNDDQGLLDIDFLEFNELEKDALEESEAELDFSELDIDELDVEYLVDVLDIIDSSDLFDTLGEFDIKGAARGFNEESQYNVYLEDGSLVLYRKVNGTIKVKIGTGNNFTLETNTPTWEGNITGNDGEDVFIYINQVN